MTIKQECIKEQLKIFSRFIFIPFSKKVYCYNEKGEIVFKCLNENDELFGMGLGEWCGEDPCIAHAYNLMDIWNTWKAEKKLLFFRFLWNFGIYGKRA